MFESITLSAVIVVVAVQTHTRLLLVIIRVRPHSKFTPSPASCSNSKRIASHRMASLTLKFKPQTSQLSSKAKKS